MRLPRDLSGERLASLQARHYGYSVIRTRGSHMTATLAGEGGTRHSVTIPRHRDLRLGTLDGIVTDVAEFVGQSKREVRETHFG